jgi:hypothetical protein
MSMTDAPEARGTAERQAVAVLVVSVIIGRLAGDSFPRHLPFISALDLVGTADQWRLALDLGWWSGAALVATRWFRVGALVAGACELLRVLGNMPWFSNGRTFDALLLLLVGLSSAHTGMRWLRVQYLLLYAGAALNKALDADWFNGVFMAATLVESAPGRLIVQIPGIALASGWLVMAVEVVIPILLTRAAWRRAGVWLCLSFHTMMVAILREDFGTFYYAVGSGAVLLFYPFARIEQLRAPRWLLRLLRRTAFLSVVRGAEGVVDAPMLRWGQVDLSGRPAVMLLLLCTLPVVSGVVLVLTSVSRGGYNGVRDFVIVGGFLLLAAGVLRQRIRDRPDLKEGASAL